LSIDYQHLVSIQNSELSLMKEDKTTKKNVPIYLCPIKEPIGELAFDYQEIEPLLGFLYADAAIKEAHTFERGTVRPDGRLDCCKQDLGAAGAKLLTDALKDNSKIEAILFGTGALGDQGAKHVADLLKENQSIKTVYLGCNYIESKGVAYLTAAIKDNSNVRSLWLKRNPIGTEGAKHIAQLLVENQHIRTLDLVNTHIGLDGLREIVNALIVSKHPLERLYLSGNAFGAKEAKLLANLLAENQYLTELLLSVNNFGSEGAYAIAEGLSSNKTLQNLSLASNGIGEKGGIALIQAVQTHPTLERLDLGYARSTKVLGSAANEIGDLGASVVKTILEENHQLLHLNLMRNSISIRGIQQIVEGLRENKTLLELPLGKGIPQKIKLRIKALLARNLENSHKEKPMAHKDVRIIKSVYR